MAADKIVWGEAPPANVTEFPPGSVWMTITRLGSDATGKTFSLKVWSRDLPYQIDWGDGTLIYPVAWATTPTPTALGTVVLNHAYTGRGGTLYRIMAEVGGVRNWAQVAAGEPVVVDDVTVQSDKRPHDPDLQPSVFRERSQLAVSIRKQMKTTARMTKPSGGMVNR